MIPATGLFEQMTDFTVLRTAAVRAARGHRGTAEACAFLCELEGQVLALQRALRSGQWAPAPLRRFHIRDPKPRRISAVPFADRVLHHALCGVLLPILERSMVSTSYACRVGTGVGASVRGVQSLVRRFPYFLKVDIHHFFETVDHGVLLSRLRPRLGDPQVFALIEQILASGAEHPGVGLPIGSLCSQHLGNFLLSFLDLYCLRQLKIRGHTRYMDDLLLFHSDATCLYSKEKQIADFVEHKLNQQLKFSATRRGPVSNGVPWLGFRIWPRLIRLDGSRKRRLARVLRKTTDPRVLGSVISWVAQANTMNLRRRLLTEQK